MQWHRLGCGLWDRVAVARQLPRHYQPASARPRSHRIGTHGCLLFGERGLHRIHHAPLQPAYYGSLSNTLQERYHKDSNKCQTQYRWRSNSSTYQSADIFHISKLFSTQSSVHLDVILVNFHDGRIIYKWVLEYNVGSACGGIGTALHVSMSTESDGMHSVNLQQSQNLLHCNNSATTVQQLYRKICVNIVIQKFTAESIVLSHPDAEIGLPVQQVCSFRPSECDNQCAWWRRPGIIHSCRTITVR